MNESDWLKAIGVFGFIRLCSDALDKTERCFAASFITNRTVAERERV